MQVLEAGHLAAYACVWVEIQQGLGQAKLGGTFNVSDFQKLQGNTAE